MVPPKQALSIQAYIIVRLKRCLNAKALNAEPLSASGC